MRLGVISDIHGNYPALKQVIIELHKLNCDKIICLGDVAGYYSMINECVDLLRKEKIVCIKGNHDSYLMGEGSCPRSNSVNRCFEFQKSMSLEFEKSANQDLKWAGIRFFAVPAQIFFQINKSPYAQE